MDRIIKPRKKRSILWKISTQALQELVSRSKTITEVLNHFGMRSEGGNSLTLKGRLIFDKIDFSHIPQGRGSGKGLKRGGAGEYDYGLIFCKDSGVARITVKRRIIKDKLLPYKCSLCPVDNIWNNKELSLVLDHINGIHNDHRLENLRFVCPNCNSQLDTHCSKNNKHYIVF